MNFWDKLMGTDEGAANYMASYGEGPGCATRHLLGSFINDGESVLDVGCGPGWNLDHFQEYGPEIYLYQGRDYSERFVRVANQRLDKMPKFGEAKHKYKVGALRFIRGDVRKINASNNSWDVVILQDVLEHTNGYEKPVKEALRVAKKRVIVTFWHLTENDDHINDDGDDGWGAWYSKPRWEEFLDSLNLHWLHDEITDNKVRDFYIIDKQVKHGK